MSLIQGKAGIGGQQVTTLQGQSTKSIPQGATIVKLVSANAAGGMSHQYGVLYFKIEMLGHDSLVSVLMFLSLYHRNICSYLCGTHIPIHFLV